MASCYKLSVRHGRKRCNYFCSRRIMQLPAGTGKTFIGYKLLEMLMKKSRVLVLTYKNHALDDFLQHCVEGQYTDQMARIGRNSTDSAELQACNLRSIKKKLSFCMCSRRSRTLPQRTCARTYFSPRQGLTGFWRLVFLRIRETDSEVVTVGMPRRTSQLGQYFGFGP